jgi:hypothetical protein
VSITKTEALETLEEIYEFFNVGYEKGFIGSDDPDVIVAFDHVIGKFKQVLDEMKEVENVATR